MAAPDTAARLQMISMARPPSMYTVCFRSSRLIRYRCESRSTRKRMSTTFCSRSRSRRPACRSSGRAPSRGFALTRSVGHPSTLPRRCLRSRVGSCTPWPSRPRSQHSTARAAARCRSGSAATTPRLHSKAPPPWAASKRARRHRGCQANKGRSVAPIPLPHPLPHHHPPSLLLRFSRAHVRARGVQANLGTAAALRATKRSSGLQVRRPSTTARNRHTARCGTPRSHPPSLPLPPSRRRPLRSAQRPVPSRRPLARRPTSRQSTAELGRRRASAVAWRIRSRRMGGPTGWAPCLRASRTGSTATCPPASATPRRRMACRTLSRPGRHRPPSVSTLAPPRSHPTLTPRRYAPMHHVQMYVPQPASPPQWGRQMRHGPPPMGLGYVPPTSPSHLRAPHSPAPKVHRTSARIRDPHSALGPRSPPLALARQPPIEAALECYGMKQPEPPANADGTPGEWPAALKAEPPIDCASESQPLHDAFAFARALPRDVKDLRGADLRGVRQRELANAKVDEARRCPPRSRLAERRASPLHPSGPARAHAYAYTCTRAVAAPRVWSIPTSCAPLRCRRSSAGSWQPRRGTKPCTARRTLRTWRARCLCSARTATNVSSVTGCGIAAAIRCPTCTRRSCAPRRSPTALCLAKRETRAPTPTRPSSCGRIPSSCCASSRPANRPNSCA